MKINGWDIANADARQWNVTPGFHSVKNDSDWVRGSPFPVMLKSGIGFKKMNIRVLIKCDGGRQVILDRCSEILSRLLAPAELELDKFDHKFYGVLTGVKHSETVMKRWHTLTLSFDCYEYGEEESQSFSGKTAFSVNNPGSTITPAVVEITPQMALISLEITGLCRDAAGTDLPITVKSLEKSKTVIIDGETGLVTQDGALKAADVEFWATPTLLPKSNAITVSSNLVDITLRYRPRFM